MRSKLTREELEAAHRNVPKHCGRCGQERKETWQKVPTIKKLIKVLECACWRYGMHWETKEYEA